MEIKVGDFVLIDSKFYLENTVLMVVDINKNNQIFGITVESPYSLGVPTYIDTLHCTKITDPNKIEKLKIKYKIRLLQKS